MLEFLNQKVNLLVPKQRRKREVLPLRDPVYTELLQVFFFNAA